MNSLLIIIGLLLATFVSSEVVTSAPVFKTEREELLDFSNKTSIRQRLPRLRQSAWLVKVANLGGSITIQQGSDLLQPARRIDAVLTPAMRRTGTGPSVVVPNFQRFQTDFNRGGARCHIIGAQLGGAGNVQANLFPGFQNRFNSPAMRGCENAVAQELGAGNTVRYTVELEYGSNYYPDSVRLKATLASGRRLFHVRISNTRAAPVTRLP